MTWIFKDELRKFGPDAVARPTRAEALAYCAELTATHYENFSVVTWLTPKAHRAAFQSIYAFCRWSDDLGDEVGDPARSLELLDWWRGELRSMDQGRAVHPVMIALREVVDRYAIPIAPFEALISAFEQDQTVTEYETYAQLLDYCTRSANPVGHLVLYVAGAFNAENARLADATCTGLQLANFWQDVARDLAIGRIYLPREDRERFGCLEADLRASRATPAFTALLKFEVERARALLDEGRALVPRIPRPFAVDVDLFSRGGLAVLDRIEARGFDVLSARPQLSRWTKLGLLARAASSMTTARLLNHRSEPLAINNAARPLHEGPGERSTADGPEGQGPLAPTIHAGPPRAGADRGDADIPRRLKESYRFCETAARREARNFYGAFRLLPRARRQSMSALYAFLRHTDDLADSPGASNEKARALEDWGEALDAALIDRGRTPHGDWPGFLALADTVARHQIPAPLLHEVIAGVSMDLDPQGFATFDELAVYCHRVASAVGLSCLHIWGYRSNGGEAERLAEHCGLALQLTNILRDLCEDARAGRTYLPREDLERFEVRPEEFAAAGPPSDRVRALLAFQARRAYEYYDSARKLVPLVAPVGRPVLRAIVGTYRALLDEIVRRDYRVFDGRIALPAPRKLAIAVKALAGKMESGPPPRALMTRPGPKRPTEAPNS